MSRPTRPLLKPARSSTRTMDTVGGGGMTDIDFDLTPANEIEEETKTNSHPFNSKSLTSSNPSASSSSTAVGSAARAAKAQKNAKPFKSSSTTTAAPAPTSISPSPPMSTAISPSPGHHRPDSMMSVELSSREPPLATSSRHWAVTPGTVEFTSVVGESIYSTVVVIQNISVRRRGITILRPKTDQFSMELSTVHTDISPGLSLKIKIYFQCPPPPKQQSEDSDEEFAKKLKLYQTQSWHDQIIVMSGEEEDKEQFMIPLHAYGKKSALQFNSFINYETVQSDATVTQLLSIRNNGPNAGKYRIEFDKGIPLVITPASGTVAPAGQEGSQIQVRCELSTPELPLGPFRSLGRIFIDDNPIPMVLDLNANIVEASLQLIWPTIGGQEVNLSNLTAKQLEKIAEIYFGSLYFGETRKIDAILVNNSPINLNFLVNLSDARDEKHTTAGLESGRQPSSARDDSRSIAGSVLGDHDLDGHDGDAPFAGATTYYRPDILVSPVEGRLEPYGSTKLTFIFQPTQPKHLKKEMQTGFKNQAQGTTIDRIEPPFVAYKAICKIDSLDGKYRTVVPVAGNANIPCVQLSEDLFEFGTCPVHEHVDRFITIKNVSSELNLAFEFESIAQFTASPAFGSLKPHESKRVLLSFQPNNLGAFKKRIMNLKLLGSPEGKKPSMLIPKAHMSKASQKAIVEQAKLDAALVLYPLTLSGTSETIGLNRTLQLTTGGPTKLASTFKKPLVLVKSREQVQEEKELDGLKDGEGEIMFGLNDDPANTQGDIHLPPGAGSKKPFVRATGWKNETLSSQYSGRYEVQPGSLDARVTFTPAELHARTSNREYYRSFLAGQHKQHLGPKEPPLEFEPEPDINDPSAQARADETVRDLKGMGLKFADGLKEPSLSLPPPAEQLKLHYSMGGFEGEGRKRLMKKGDDAAIVKKKVLKTVPSTRAEKRDCEATLSPEDLQMIIRGPKILEFGKLCRHASGTKNFQVTNDLEQHILVELKIRTEELAQTTPVSQMIPPGETATFPVTFSSPVEQEFKKSIIYTINGQHDYNFMATAFVVPMDLNMSKEELNFEFKPESTSFSTSEYITLENIYNVPTEFYFNIPTQLIDSFTVTPSKGVVGPLSKLKVEVKFEPKYANPQNAPLTSEILLHIKDGPGGGATSTSTAGVTSSAKRLVVRAVLVEARVGFLRGVKTLDFGKMCVGTPITKTVALRNEGQSRTVIRFEDLPPGVKIKPQQVKLETGTTVNVAVTVYPVLDLKLKHAVIVNVRGKAKEAKPLKLHLKGEAFLPSLTILEDELSFGGVTLGSSGSRLVSIQNTGAVPSTVFLDFSRSSEFTMSYAEELGNERVDHADGITRPPVIQRISTQFIKRNGSTSTLEAALATEASTSAAALAAAAVLRAEQEGSDEHLGHSIYVAPYSVVTFTLTFTPTKVVDHVFELPISVSGIPSYSALRRVITAHGLKPRISLSSNALDFGKRVLLKKGRAHKNPYISKFVLKNEDSSAISWFLQSEPQVPQTPTSAGFGTPSLNSSRIPSRLGTASASPASGSELAELNWRVEPSSGTLPAGQEIAIMVYFSPTASIPYTYPVDIYLDGGIGTTIEPLKETAPPQVLQIHPPHIQTNLSSPQTKLKPYTSILLTGVGTTPRLIFDVEELVLPVVPLGIKSTSVFHIRNDGYENLELRYEITMDTQRAPITIRLPEGSTLGLTHPVLPVEVTFLTTKPVSFTLQLHFFDNENNKFVLPVTGTSDNSVMTVENYLESHPNKFEIISTPQPPPKTSSSSSSTTNVDRGKILTLVELSVAKSQEKFAVGRGTKSIYNNLQPMDRAANRHRGFDFDGSDDGGEEDDHVDELTSNFNTPGSNTRTPDDLSRLTPIRMLGQNSHSGGGESLFTHTLDSVLAYLNAAKLLSSNEIEDENLLDTPPLSPGQGNSEFGSVPNTAGSMRSTKQFTSSALLPTVKKPERVTMSISATTFPADLIKTQGKIIRNLVRNLSGKIVPTQASKKSASFGNAREKAQTMIMMSTHVTVPIGTAEAAAADESNEPSSLHPPAGYHPPNTSTSAKSDEIIHTIYLDYVELLIFMKSQGCLLGNVQPWHLLSWNQLLRLLNSTTVKFNDLGVTSTMTASEISGRQRKLEQDFPGLSRLGWLALLVQLIKVFILSRVTPQQFRTLPGMSADLPCMNYNYSGSNLFSVSESILLEWVSYHYNRSNPLQPRQILDFHKELSDGLVLAGVLSSHIPNLQNIQHLRTHILSTDDCMYNAGKVILALKEIGLNYSLTASQLVNAHMRDMVLLILFLYQKLPHFVPKTTLEFRGALAEDMVKCIELSNPSTRAITYSVYLEGSPDFKVDKYSIKLAPRGKAGSTVKFPVRFKARFSKPVEARLVFNSNEEMGGLGAAAGASSASTLVFLLKSHILSRNPTAVYNTSSKVYETSIIDVRVTNMFAGDCTFNIAVKLEQEPSATSGKNALGKPNPNDPLVRQQSSIDSITTGGGAGRLTSARSSSSAGTVGGASDRLPPPFFLPYERIKLRAGETVSMFAHFLPLRIGAYRAHVIFLDELCGEFMIELNGQALPPPPHELFKWTTTSKASDTKELQFSFKNPGIDLARQSTFERVRALTRQQRDLKKNKSDWASQILKPDVLPSGGAVHYNIHSTSPFFHAPSSVLLHDIKLEKDSAKKIPHAKGKAGLPLVVTDLSVKTMSDKHRSAAGSPTGAATPVPTAASLTAQYLSNKIQPDNKVSVLFNPRGPGVYRGELVLTSLFDSRVYGLEVTVLADEIPPVLEFQVPARQVVTQDIPISNNSSDIWTMKANLLGKGFSGPADVTVYPNSVGAYPLSFAPNWVCDSIGTLSLYNSKTDEKFTYDLHGIGDEPLAERHVIIEGAARSTIQHKLAVTNSSNTDIYYTVECDVPSFAGPTNCRIGAGQTVDYTFTLSPAISGTLLGSLTFNQADKKFQWFSVEVHVTPPEAEGEIVINTPCRKASTVSLAIVNPLAEPLTLDVNLEGLGLFGPKTLQLEANESKPYEFLYSPLIPVKDFEAALAFSSEAIGEFWYRLMLTATPPEPITLEFGAVEVGTTKSLEVTLENPTNETIQLKCVSTNSRNFMSKPPSLTIQPLTSQTIELRYTPSTMDENQSATLSFKHPDVGDWIYQVSGMGKKPAEMPETFLSTPIGSRISRTLAFRNPFATKLKIDIDLNEKTSHGTPVNLGPSSASGTSTPVLVPGMSTATFQLFMKRTHGLVLAPYSIIQIPFIFSPNVIADHLGSIRVSASEQQLVWTFPLRGVAEGQTSEHPIVIETQARQPWSGVQELRLIGLPTLNNIETFKVEVEAPDDTKEKLTSFLKVNLLTKQLSSAQPLRVELTLTPMTPFVSHAFLVVSKLSGGRWKFPLIVTVAAPEPDDTIRLEAAVNTTSSVAFRLKNTRNHAVPFTASLTNDSSSTFHIWPRQGVLPVPTADDSEGTQFIVSFSPTEYGKPLTGSLQIETKDMVYVYALIGSHASYVPPQVKSHLDNRLEDKFKAQDSPRKNMILSNMRTAKEQPLVASKTSQVKAWKYN